MRSSILRITVGVPLALVSVAVGTAVAFPAGRHLVLALWNSPERLPSLAENSQVHFERGAEDYARVVSALLPEAIARVEAAHGRPFAHPAAIGAYATPAAYASANGLGSDAPVGTTFFGRVHLSPKLFRSQRVRIRAILTHELSHAHLQGWIGGNGFVHLPNWFKEGLAVMISGGGGAEWVSEEEARIAIQRGEVIAIEYASSLQSLGDIRFDRAPAKTVPSWYPVVMAYRQAGMFVTHLRDSDVQAFERLMSELLDGRPFSKAVVLSYGHDVQDLWQKFAQTCAGRK
jgi:hypothetical protein